MEGSRYDPKVKDHSLGHIFLGNSIVLRIPKIISLVTFFLSFCACSIITFIVIADITLALYRLFYNCLALIFSWQQGAFFIWGKVERFLADHWLQSLFSGFLLCWLRIASFFPKTRNHTLAVQLWAIWRRKEESVYESKHQLFKWCLAPFQSASVLVSHKWWCKKSQVVDVWLLDMATGYGYSGFESTSAFQREALD